MLALATAVSGCAKGDASESSPGSRERKIDVLEVQMPEDILGLKMQPEDIEGALEAVRPSYVEAAALYSFRSQDNVVQATLQVSRFFDEPRYKTSRFRRTIINQIGSTAPTETRMDDHRVWRTAGNNAARAIWFDGRHMYLLSAREAFPFPRTLIRNLLDLKAGRA